MLACLGRLAATILAVLGSAAAPAAAAEIQVKASEVGSGAAPGEVRRTIQPFGGWTLICDENTRRRDKVCNVSQVLVDAGGQQVFSWSLAATRGGAPVMILRAPSQLVRLQLGAAGKMRDVPLTSCNDAICLGLLPVDREIADAIRRGAVAQVVLSRDGRFASFEASTVGLAAALKAVR